MEKDMKAKTHRMPDGSIMKNSDMKDKPKAKRAPNPWIKHVAEVRKKNPGKSLKEILTLAKASYKK